MMSRVSVKRFLEPSRPKAPVKSIVRQPPIFGTGSLICNSFEWSGWKTASQNQIP
jgi:hypothetical protein